MAGERSASDTVLKCVNLELAKELSSVETALDAEQHKTEELTEKLKRLGIRNTYKKLKRRDDKIQSYESKISTMQECDEAMTNEVAKLEKCLQTSKLACERNRIACYCSSHNASSVSVEIIRG